MIVISVVRLRKVWLPWVARFVFIMALIYLLSAAFEWFFAVGDTSMPDLSPPAVFATRAEGSLG